MAENHTLVLTWHPPFGLNEIKNINDVRPMPTETPTPNTPLPFILKKKTQHPTPLFSLLTKKPNFLRAFLAFFVFLGLPFPLFGYQEKMQENKDPTIKLFGKKIPLTAEADEVLLVSDLEKEKCGRVEVVVEEEEEEEDDDDEELEEDDKLEKVQSLKIQLQGFMKF